MISTFAVNAVFRTKVQPYHIQNGYSGMLSMSAVRMALEARKQISCIPAKPAQNAPPYE
jgi:hypothetical protein